MLYYLSPIHKIKHGNTWGEFYVLITLMGSTGVSPYVTNHNRHFEQELIKRR